MDRISNISRWLFLVALSLPAFADVVMAPRPTYPPMSDRGYPESSFGQKSTERRSPASARREGAFDAAKKSQNGDFDPGAKKFPGYQYGVQEVALIAGDLGYFPRTIFLTKSIPVRLYVTSTSEKTLCIIMDSFNVRKQVSSRKIEEITFTPTYPGKYKFHCPINGMEGTIVVKEISTSTVSQYR